MSAKNTDSQNYKKQELFGMFFFLPTVGMIGFMNSFWVSQRGLSYLLFPLSALFLLFYFSYLIKIASPYARMMFLIGMMVCAFGENLFVYGLSLYHFSPTLAPPYAIPTYVILGHGYVIWTSLMCQKHITPAMSSKKRLWIFLSIGAILYFPPMIYFSDYTGGAWLLMAGVPFFASTKRETKILFCYTFIIGTLLEYVGVFLRAWEWHTLLNPPTGVGGFYVFGEWVTILIVEKFGIAQPENMEEKRRI